MDINIFEQTQEGETFRNILAAQDFLSWVDGGLSVCADEYDNLSEDEISLLKKAILPHRYFITDFLSRAHG